MICKSCLIVYKHDETNCFWDENGTYSIKYSICPVCKKINIIKSEIYFTEDINNDERYYTY